MKAGGQRRSSRKSGSTSTSARAAAPAKWPARRFTPSRSYSSINPARSRIRVVADEINDEYVPVRAGNFTPQPSATAGISTTLNGKQYSECSFCRASCPSRDYFIEPDSGLPLKCDMCEDEPPLAEPLCVTVCQPGCLTYEPATGDAGRRTRGTRSDGAGLESLVSQHGIEAVIDNLKRLADRL